MATRSTTRSQKAPAGSQARSQAPHRSQPGPSQARRGSRRAGRAEDDEDDEDDQEHVNGNPDAAMDTDGDQDGENGGARGGENDIKRKASELVRLALFTEHKRIPLKREEITKKVLGSNSRAFAHVFEYAQDILRKTFGMELAELPSRAGLETDTNVPEDELNEARKATGIKKKAAAAGSKTYILRSILHPLIIEHAAQTHGEILEVEAEDMPSDGDDGDDDDGSFTQQYYGSIISWSHLDNVGPLGIIYTLLALILVSGRSMSDVEFRSLLKRLGFYPNSHVTFSAHATTSSVPIEQYLGTLIRQGYLDRFQVSGADGGVGAGAKKGTGAKRGRVSLGGVGDDGEGGGGPTYEWRWGVRAMSEVGEKSVAKLIAEFMVGGAGVDDGEEDEEEDQHANGRKRGGKGGREKKDGMEERLERMLKGVERAAGGSLTDI